MGLETSTYVNGLNAANPAATDGLSQADDHLRLIKSTIKNTLPNITGAITATQAELNALDGFTGTVTDLNYAKDLRATGVTAAEFDYLDGVTSNIQTQLNAKSSTAISISAGSGLSGGGTLSADRTISHADTSTQASVNNSGNTFIQDITLDDFGHITAITSAAAAFSGLTVSASDFTGTDGYIKFSNNFMIQWGQVDPATGTQAVTFSPAFGSAVVWASAQLIDTSQNYQSTAINPNYTTSGMTIYSDNDTNMKLWWIAMGI